MPLSSLFHCFFVAELFRSLDSFCCRYSLKDLQRDPGPGSQLHLSSPRSSHPLPAFLSLSFLATCFPVGTPDLIPSGPIRMPIGYPPYPLSPGNEVSFEHLLSPLEGLLLRLLLLLTKVGSVPVFPGGVFFQPLFSFFVPPPRFRRQVDPFRFLPDHSPYVSRSSRDLLLLTPLCRIFP